MEVRRKAVFERKPIRLAFFLVGSLLVGKYLIFACDL